MVYLFSAMLGMKFQANTNNAGSCSDKKQSWRGITTTQQRLPICLLLKAACVCFDVAIFKRFCVDSHGLIRKAFSAKI